MGVCMCVPKRKGLRTHPWGLAAFKELGKNNMLLRVSDLHIIHMRTHPNYAF